MAIWDYISSTANSVNQNTLIPVWNFLYSTSTSTAYGRSAIAKIIAAVPELSNDEEARSNAAQFATTFAKNAAVFVFRQCVRTIPGGKPIYDIVSRSFHDSQKNDQQKNPELRALVDQEKPDLRAVSRALKDQEKQIKEMKEEINNLKQVANQVEVDEQDISGPKPELREVRRALSRL